MADGKVLHGIKQIKYRKTKAESLDIAGDRGS